MPSLGANTFLPPTRTFAGRLEVTIAGVRMQLVHVPSEAPDEIAIYLPEKKILLSAETIQGPTLPNIHTLRGTKFRDPVSWVRSIDVLRDFQAEHLVPSHGQPVSGAASSLKQAENVLRVLTGRAPHGLANPEVIKTIAVMRSSSPGRWEGIPDFAVG